MDWLGGGRASSHEAASMCSHRMASSSAADAKVSVASHPVERLEVSDAESPLLVRLMEVRAEDGEVDVAIDDRTLDGTRTAAGLWLSARTDDDRDGVGVDLGMELSRGLQCQHAVLGRHRPDPVGVEIADIPQTGPGRVSISPGVGHRPRHVTPTTAAPSPVRSAMAVT